MTFLSQRSFSRRPSSRSSSIHKPEKFKLIIDTVNIKTLTLQKQKGSTENKLANEQ